ncbi:MAG: transcriptional regulator [Acidobacteria bacterium]|nr:MAG: transcriptional regulator [Acidobacteriota bacterium]
MDGQSSVKSSQYWEPLFPFLDLKAQFDDIKNEVMEAVSRVFEDQRFILGPEVELLENEIAALVGARAAVGCASGSDALLLSLKALGIGPGDEVITTPFTFVATVGSMARAGARPVLVDIRPDTFNLDSNLIEAAISSRTRAILPVHLFGLAADLDPILQLAEAHRLAVVEDAAQAIGACYRGRHVGSLGAAGCFSFYPSKNLGGAGDGGMVTTNDAQVADQLRRLRDHGRSQKYSHEVLGMNSRLDALQAAILRVKLLHLANWTRRRQEKAERYRALFDEAALDGNVKLPAAPPGCFHVYNQFTVRSSERDRLREFLRARGIPTEIYYPRPLHLQPAFGYLGYRAGEFPAAEAASREVLSLPIYPELKEEHQGAVVRAIADFYGTNRGL